MNCKYQNNILKSFFVVLNHFWKFEVESKFCQKLKNFMTVFLSKISDFNHFLNIVIYDLWVNCKYQNHILKWFFCSFKCSLDDLKDLWKFEVESNFVKN